MTEQPSLGARVAAVFSPKATVKEQGLNGFKTPSRAMAATITLVLLALFSMSYVAPYLNVSWIKPDVKPDVALQQNLLMLLAISITYYIGSSKGSAEANDTIRAQVATSPPSPPPAPSPSPLGSGPTGNPDDPVAVTEVKPSPPSIERTSP